MRVAYGIHKSDKCTFTLWIKERVLENLINAVKETQNEQREDSTTVVGSTKKSNKTKEIYTINFSPSQNSIEENKIYFCFLFVLPTNVIQVSLCPI